MFCLLSSHFSNDHFQSWAWQLFQCWKKSCHDCTLHIAHSSVFIEFIAENASEKVFNGHIIRELFYRNLMQRRLTRFQIQALLVVDFVLNLTAFLPSSVPATVLTGLRWLLFSILHHITSAKLNIASAKCIKPLQKKGI